MHNEHFFVYVLQCCISTWSTFHIQDFFSHQCWYFLQCVSFMTGNKPPGVIPNKFQYMGKDLARLSEYFDVPLQTPADPFEVMFNKGTMQDLKGHVPWYYWLNQDRSGTIASNLVMQGRGGSCSVFFFFFLLGSLNAMRFVTAVQEREKLGDNQVERVSRELWRRIWKEDKDITEPSSLSEVPAYPTWRGSRRLRNAV